MMYIVFETVKLNRPGFQGLLGRITLGLLLVMVLARPVEFVSIQAQSDNEDPITRIDAMFALATERDDFSGAVLIAQDGEVLLRQGYGFAVREWNVPNTPESVFRISGVTKQFTGMAILILQESGLLTVQDPVCQYLEECPETWVDITIHHLLTHTSGIPNFMVFPDYKQTQMIRSRPENTIERFINEPLDFAPGEVWSYSNSGYIILGYIIEQVSGDSYQTFLQQNIFDPLGMENTAYSSASTRLIEYRAEGYTNPPLRRANYLDMSIPFAAGGLHSTVDDLYLWTQALFGSEVVSQESWDTMVGAAYTFPSDAWDVRYGYGLMWADVLYSPLIGHSGTFFDGGVNGFSSFVVYYPEVNVTAIVLANIDLDTPTIDNYLDLIPRILFED